MSPYDVTRPQWFNKAFNWFCNSPFSVHALWSQRGICNHWVLLQLKRNKQNMQQFSNFKRQEIRLARYFYKILLQIQWRPFIARFIIANISWSSTLISLHNMLPFELIKDTPYLALSGELWSVFYEYFNRNWSCYRGFLLYMKTCSVITIPITVWGDLPQKCCWKGGFGAALSVLNSCCTRQAAAMIWKT